MGGKGGGEVKDVEGCEERGKAGRDKREKMDGEGKRRRGESWGGWKWRGGR